MNQAASCWYFQLRENFATLNCADILAKMVNYGKKSLQTIAEAILPESQRGFHPSLCTIDVIFILRQLQEKTIEHQQSLFVVFTALSEVFDATDWSTLWILLRRCGCPDTSADRIQEFHDGAMSIGGSTIDLFEISHGLKQGCVLAPILFTLFLAAVLSKCPNTL